MKSSQLRRLTFGVWVVASLLVGVYAVGWRLEARDLQHEQQVLRHEWRVLWLELEDLRGACNKTIPHTKE